MQDIAPTNQRRWTTLMPAVVIVALTMIVYFPAVHGGILWDDGDLIFENPFIHAANGLHHFWLTTGPPDYFPLSSTSHWLEWRLWGADTTGYHLVNTALHAASAVLIWLVLRRLAVPASFVAAAIFAVHPVTVSSVAWISERKNTLSMFLFCLSMLSYVRFDDSPRTATGRRWCWYSTALCTFVLALLAKTSVVMMPVFLMLLIWWRRQRITKRDMITTVPFFGVSLVLGLVTVFYHFHRAIGAAEVRPEGFLSRLAAAGWCVWFYLYKCLMPVRLSMIYPRWQVDPQGLLSWIPLIGLVAVFVVAWRYRNSWSRPLLMSLTYFVVMLLPVLGLIDMVYHQHALVADHLQYVGLIGPIVLVVGAAAKQLRRWEAGQWTAVVVATCVIGGLSVLTWQKASVFRSQLTLWSDTLEKNPDTWAGHYNQGRALQLFVPPLGKGGQGGVLRNNVDEAIKHYRLALAIKPDHANAHNLLGVALAMKGNHGEAMNHFHQALNIAPNNAKIHNNMGLVLSALGKLEDAIHHYRRALELNPNSSQARNNLGLALARSGELDEAITSFRRALQIDRNYAKAHRNLIQSLLQAERPGAAIEHCFQEAEHLLNRDATLLAMLASAFAATGQLNDAVAAARTALELATEQRDEILASRIRDQLQRYGQAIPNEFQPDNGNDRR